MKMTILDKIVENKISEVKRSKESISQSSLETSKYFKRTCNSLVASLNSLNSTGIIAEFKRKSPSKGDINISVGIVETSQSYTKAGAACLSVLTDTLFFGGFKEDLFLARDNNPTIPILRKDFMVDSYQVYEAKSWGADVILLIAACLNSDQILEMSKLAHDLGMEVLLEIHDEKELEASPLEFIDVVGVNNRNLKNFNENNVNASLKLAELIPVNKTKISESCISEAATIQILKAHGYKGFLIGETFMKTKNPGLALENLVNSIV
jgi:indole-3-glycerol phosphate synthase